MLDWEFERFERSDIQNPNSRSVERPRDRHLFPGYEQGRQLSTSEKWWAVMVAAHFSLD